ncbi:hypothetical protein [Gryllotalpicola protaetiae]|nr:hypothetical protein [Gryllotalpicola protaetiae]
MRIPGRTVLAACALALAASLLAACTPSHPAAEPTKTPKSTPTPVFTSDADALAAATTTFTQFEAASDRVASAGWTDPGPLRSLVSADGYKHEQETAAKYRSQHAHATGSTVINNTQLESHRQDGGEAVIRMYVCEDLSGVDILDDTGMSLVDPSRADFVSYLIELEGTSSNKLVVQSIDYWSGGGICKA